MGDGRPKFLVRKITAINYTDDETGIHENPPGRRDSPSSRLSSSYSGGIEFKARSRASQIR